MKLSYFRSWTVLVFSVSILCFVSMAAATDVPQTLNYQGYLEDTSGPISGTKDITFRLYDDLPASDPATTAFWTETQTVNIVKGQFSVVLGGDATNPLNSSKFTGKTYIGIQVGTNTEMAPRQKFTSVAYALKAADAIPKGVIVMWSGSINTIPADWALCDGLEKTRPDGTKVTPPDLRDRFIVGTGTSYNVSDTGGSATINLAHSHVINPTDTNHTHNDDHNHSGRVNASDGGRPNRTDGGSTQLQADHTHTFSTNYKSEQGHGVITAWMNQNSSHSHSENSQLSSALDVRPPYYALAFIMKL